MGRMRQGFAVGVVSARNHRIRAMVIVGLAVLIATSAGANVTGSVFRDFNADGVRGTFEPGIGGVVVNAFGGAGTPVGNSPQTTAFDGSYTLSGLPAGPLRIELTLPAGGSLDFLEAGAAGRTSAAFAADGDTVDVGFSNPAQYCQANPDVAVNCFVNGDLLTGSGSGNDALVSIPYNGFAVSGDSDAPRDKINLALANQIGTAWGIAYQRRTRTIFTSATHKRHSSFGPLGPGGIYQVDLTSGTVSNFFDLNATGGLFNAGVDVHTGLGNLADPSNDPASFDAAGKTSLGDLAISDDDQTLWLVNVQERTLLEIPIGVPATAPDPMSIVAHAIPINQCTNGEFRPWAVEVHDGQVYVGGVCSGENGGTQADLFAFVYRHDPAGAPSSFTEVFNFFIGYDRGCAMQFVAPFIGCNGFEPWKPDWFLDSSGNPGNPPDGPVQPPNPNLWATPQPMLTDIEIDSDGSLLLAFADRFNFQAAYENYDTINSGPGAPTYSGVGAGETVRVCNVGGSFVIEGNPTCNGTGTNGDGPGALAQEFYFADDAPIGSNIHREGTLGAVSVLHGTGEVMATITDPVRVWSGGMTWFDADEGDTSTVFDDQSAIPAGAVRRYQVFTGQFNPLETGNGKNGGLGDMELMCELAPIEIGNRVWCDAPAASDTPNGIQDPPGAAGAVDTVLAGVTVALSCNGGAITASTMTAADGTYLFDAANVTGGIPPGAMCTLSIDTAANAAALGTCNNPTTPNVGSPTDPGQDLRDSDGTDVGMNGVIEATLTVGGPGANNHAIDFGFRGPAPMPVLSATKVDALVIDADMDGMLDGGDTLRYTVVITNTGDADATGTTFVSTVDANTSLVVGSVTTSQGMVTTGNTAGDTAVAVAIGTLVQGGGSVTITYDVTLNDPVAAGVTQVTCQGDLGATNHPTTMTDDPDDPTSGTDPTTTPVDAAPSIAATKVDALLVDGDMDGLADAGDTLKYTVVVTNSGDQDASATMFTSSVDANTTLVVGSVTTSQGTVITGNTAGDTSVAVAIGTLAGGGGSATLMYEVTVDTPIPAGVTQVACQGTVTGTNVPTTPTDDPDDPAPGDPTDTPLDLGADFGDAPDSYTTTASPSHALDSATAIYLGACVDADTQGQPALSGDPADGDDLNDLGMPGAILGTCAGNDDEDGVSFGSMIIACSTTNLLTVVSAGGGLLDAWIDFDGDGSFAGASEQIFTSQALAGNDMLTFAAPCSTLSGMTYARFRVSSAGGLSFSGAAANGEVEDYQVTTKGLDYGDAPETYTTTVSPSHAVDPGSLVYLGSCVDTEPAGAPTTGANGDDLASGGSALGTCVGNDDEDGVTFDTMIVACATDSELTVTSVGAGLLDAWIDFSGDGDFGDAGEQIFTDQALTGSDTLTFTTPCTTAGGTTYARFRVSTAGGLSFDGAARDGEVEDYQVTTKGLDYGDAPDGYGTTQAVNGPAHIIVPGYSLGTAEDGEADGQPNMASDGDDTDADGDDEDGIDFGVAGPMAAACSTGNPLVVTLTDTAGIGTALLDGWIDFNGNGAFDHPAEHVFGGTSQALTSGVNNLTYDVACDVTPGNVYARFRLSAAGSLTPTDAAGGPAMDGEVEDYAFEVKGIDFGDAPDSYGTTQASIGASHTIIPGYSLGTAEDTEPDGQPSMGADGDDTDADGDDEDGVVFGALGPMAGACTTGNALMVTFTNTSGIVGAQLDGWIDFDGSGAFDHPAEHVFGGVSAMLVPGMNNLTYDVPCDVVPGDVYARFRLSSTGSLIPTGPAADGEVEDYVFEVKGVDFGDAPNTYGTTQATTGPWHTIVPGYSLGVAVDTEADGQPSMTANGDDMTGMPDDEDGVGFGVNGPMAYACSLGNPLEVTLTNSAGIGTALLDAWIDFDGNGVFDQATEHLFAGASATLSAGVNSLTYDVPCDAAAGNVFARFRLSSSGSLPPTGLASPIRDGEVEDYAFALKGLDYGDAPEADGYPTLLASDGARHIVLPTNNPTLGSLVDTEADGQPSASHTGDDASGVDDEDGVTFEGMFVPGGEPVDVTVTGGATGGLLDAWIDWNGDGDWDDAGEQIASSLAVAASGTEVLSAQAPVGAPEITSCARFRFSTAGGLSPSGMAADGEIEDYSVAIGIEDPIIGMAKELVAIEEVGQRLFAVLLLIRIDNLGNVPLSGIQATTDLAGSFIEAESWDLDFIQSDDFTINPSFDGELEVDTLVGTDILEVGASGTIQLQVVVDPGGNPGPYFCSTLGAGLSPGIILVEDGSQTGGDSDPDDDGDPGNDNEPTEVVFEVSVLDIPTLGEWQMIVFTLLLLVVAIAVLRRHRLAM